MTAADAAMAALDKLAPGYAEKEPAMRKRITYPGDTVAECYDRQYFGPTYDPSGGPGRVWRIASASYDAATNKTTAWFAPVSDNELNAVLAKVQEALQHG